MTAALVIASLTSAPGVHAQSPGSAPRSRPALPEETSGVDAIARTLISVFDRVDIVALGEWHGRIRLDSDLRMALIHQPEFARKVRFIVIECGSVSEQSTLDRYIRGKDVPRTQLERVWKATEETTNGFCDEPIYPGFLAAVRDVNSKLPAADRIRVLGGHPGRGAQRGIETTAVTVLRDQVLQQHGKALVIFGAVHFYRTLPPQMLSTMGNDIGLGNKLDVEFPGRTFTVIPVGPLDAPRGAATSIAPDFGKFDRALRTTARPVLVSLQRPPFRDLSADEFLGRTMTSCSRTGGCASVFKGSTITLGQMADACVYVGGNAAADAKRKPAP